MKGGLLLLLMPLLAFAHGISEADKQLVLEAEPKRLKALDEDQLIDLHARVPLGTPVVVRD